jgi:hypothetical protein
MHLRYHMTRQGLINDRINVTMNNVSNNMESSIKSGIDIKNLGNITDLIKHAKESDHIIKDIYVLSIESDLLKSTFSTSAQTMGKKILTDLFRKMKGSKSVSWSMDLDKDNTIVGLSVRDNAGLDRAVIIVIYSKELIRKKEAAEVNALYLRMAIGAILATLVGFLIGYLTTKELSENVDCINKEFAKIEDGKFENIDLSEITDPTLKSHLRGMINAVCNALNKIQKIKNITSTFKKDSAKEGNM